MKAPESDDAAAQQKRLRRPGAGDTLPSLGGKSTRTSQLVSRKSGKQPQASRTESHAMVGQGVSEGVKALQWVPLSPFGWDSPSFSQHPGGTSEAQDLEIAPDPAAVIPIFFAEYVPQVFFFGQNNSVMSIDHENTKQQQDWIHRVED
jgi:hypothetical protein